MAMDGGGRENGLVNGVGAGVGGGRGVGTFLTNNLLFSRVLFTPACTCYEKLVEEHAVLVTSHLARHWSYWLRSPAGRPTQTAPLSSAIVSRAFQAVSIVAARLLGLPGGCVYHAVTHCALTLPAAVRIESHCDATTLRSPMQKNRTYRGVGPPFILYHKTKVWMGRY